MSVVGLMLGSGANAIRPSAASAASAATSASTRAVGWLRSYQPKPATSASPSSRSDAATQLTAPPPGVAAARRQPVLVAAVHAARRLVEADHGGPRAVQDDGQRETLALAAGEVARVTVRERRQPGGLERLGRELVADAVAERV